MKKYQKTARTGFVFLIMVITILALYYHLANRAKSTEETETVSQVQSVLVQNLTDKYPGTPREVLKYYNEILECLYNEKYSDQEFQSLAEKAEQLYDKELLDNQGKDSYLKSFREEINNSRKLGKKLDAIWMTEGTDVDYYTKNSRECANLKCIDTMKISTASQNITVLYVLRKDDKDHWKILGWKTDNENKEETEEP